MQHSNTAIQTSEQTNSAAIKSYRLECSTTSEYDHAPDVAVFCIDAATAKRIVELSKVVKEHGLYKVEKFDYRVSYLKHDPATGPELAEEAGDENDLRTDCDCLVVSDSEFWFTALAKHTDVEISCHHQPIQDLVDHFNLNPEQNCTACGEASSSVIGCPDGAEVCQTCFDNGEG